MTYFNGTISSSSQPIIPIRPPFTEVELDNNISKFAVGQFSTALAPAGSIVNTLWHHILTWGAIDDKIQMALTNRNMLGIMSRDPALNINKAIVLLLAGKIETPKQFDDILSKIKLPNQNSHGYPMERKRILAEIVMLLSRYELKETDDIPVLIERFVQAMTILVQGYDEFSSQGRWTVDLLFLKMVSQIVKDRPFQISLQFYEKVANDNRARLFFSLPQFKYFEMALVAMNRVIVARDATSIAYACPDQIKRSVELLKSVFTLGKIDCDGEQHQLIHQDAEFFQALSYLCDCLPGRMLIHLLAEEFKNEKISNPRVLEVILPHEPRVLAIADPKLLNNKDYMLGLFSRFPAVLKMFKYYRSDLLTQDDLFRLNLLRYFPKCLNDLKTIENFDDMPLYYYHRELHQDRSFVLASLNHLVFPRIAQEFKGDEQFILAALEKDGKILQHVDKKFTSNRKVVLAAVRSYPLALEWAPECYKKDRDIILKGLQCFLCFPNLIADRHLEELTSQDVDRFYQMVSSELQQDPELMEMVQRAKEIYRLASESRASRVRGEIPLANQLMRRALDARLDLPAKDSQKEKLEEKKNI